MRAIVEIACGLAETARTSEEHEAAHLAMRRAFPELARRYPCGCATCGQMNEVVAAAKKLGANANVEFSTDLRGGFIVDGVHHRTNRVP
jgi:hypothetical protein